MSQVVKLYLVTYVEVTISCDSVVCGSVVCGSVVCGSVVCGSVVCGPIVCEFWLCATVVLRCTRACRPLVT